jgi:hypothetical protein
MELPGSWIKLRGFEAAKIRGREDEENKNTRSICSVQIDLCGFVESGDFAIVMLED